MVGVSKLQFNEGKIVNRSSQIVNISYFCHKLEITMEVPTFVHRDGMIADKEYVEWLKELKLRFMRSQAKTAVKVNSAMLELY